VDPACWRQLLHPLTLPLSLCLAGPDCQSSSRCPEHHSFLPLRRGPTLSDPPSSRPPWTSACALAHVAGFLGHDAAHAPSSLLIAPLVPRAHPSPHFAQLHPLSRSALAASHRRRPAPVFPAIQLVGDRPKPAQALPRGETPVPVPNFPYCALCLSKFTFAGARRRRSAALTRWLADLFRSSSPE
jgi:hypothetical protein